MVNIVQKSNRTKARLEQYLDKKHFDVPTYPFSGIGITPCAFFFKAHKNFSTLFWENRIAFSFSSFLFPHYFGVGRSLRHHCVNTRDYFILFQNISFRNIIPILLGLFLDFEICFELLLLN